MARRSTAFAVLTASAALALSGCLKTDARKDDAAPAQPASSAAPASPVSPAAAGKPRVPAGWKTIGGPANGLRLSIPKSWTDIELLKGDYDRFLDGFKVEGMDKRTMRRGLEGLRKSKAVYAVDTKTVSGGFATNVNGLCQPLGGASPAQLKNGLKIQLTRVGAQDLQVSEVTVAGRPGILSTYRLKSSTGVLEARQYVAAAGAKGCIVTVTAPQGKLPANADTIADTVQVL
ncbi:hypothetical protein ACQEU3_07410 [Spirillospora sp. CA-253888]